MNQDPNPNHPPGSWTVGQNGQPVKSSVAFANKQLADNLARKLNKMFQTTEFGAVQKPKND